MANWQTKLMQYAEIAYKTGRELRFAVVKRQEITKWRIYLTEIKEHGEEREQEKL